MDLNRFRSHTGNYLLLIILSYFFLFSATEVWERLGTAPPGTTSASQQQKTTGNSSSSSGGHSAGGWQSGPGSQMNGSGSQGPHQWAGGGGGAGSQQQVPHPRAQSIALVFTQFR